ncbi:metallophosphoesterase [Bdellovibrio sp. HCB117]|uniref:metallophosphoesterase n=1 Tax=Bdellovibrio sp. HCB117 TaxID=3394359 RepID=UPI0039B60219
MPTSFSQPVPDFRSASFTAIISDLHLCEAEPVNIKFPLWKKFKTRQFFFDDVFENFLKHIEEKANGQPIELILNGDIFDFDSVLRLPDEPTYKVDWLERHRGLYPREERSRYKIEVILKDHAEFVRALREFVLRGHRAIFVIGNHDLELHFPEVQEEIYRHLALPDHKRDQVRFVEWFYISNQDTLIEHGNQYDPYCMCEDPINPFVRGYNYISLKLPFGNLACRYISNGMGFFNPHVDTNYIMTLPEYIRFFFKYMLRAQPGLIITWFWGSVVTLLYAFFDRLSAPIRNPLKIEDRVSRIAEKANAEPRMVRELKELFVAPAASHPTLLARELWLDRAFIVFLAFFLIFQLMVFVRSVYEISFFWAFIPLFLLLPFFLFYSKSITSLVSGYKEPDDRVLSMASAITKAQRIVFGHTHHTRHEIIGSVEHLNSGCWSPAFLDVECTKPLDQKTFVWISPTEGGSRQAELLKFVDGKSELIANPGRTVSANN